MTEDTVINITMATVWLIVKVSAPMLLVSLVVGLLISIFQTVTSIQEQTLTFVPKFLAILVTIVICGNWIMNCITTYMTELCKNFSVYIQ
ncbi:flagellar biosynthetic protein FliQ [Clostridium sp. CAG:411]|jgi:flagellar biosynthetic protein FliQ|nr:flagellar biosynthesis protein FliQ [Lachnospiraceae bacterium]CDE42943.1 flagellar biosynthetic protein FliQ [Clostridium sp. CAG:411]